MSQVAQVIFNYSPKNDDELELIQGDKIQVIGFVEQGWWKGKLNGKIGVFPSNFVQVETNSSPKATQQVVNLQNSLASGLVPPLASKLSLFNNINKSTSRTDISSNNPVESNGNGTANTYVNNNTGNSMTSNHFQDTVGHIGPGPLTGDGTEGLSISSSDNNASMPTRGPPFGDMFQSKQPIHAPTTDASGCVGGNIDRSNSSGNTLQKQIPKKPPPPTPKVVTADMSGTTSLTSSLNEDSSFSAEQAPALPPKPINQYNPSLSSRPIQALSHQHQHHHRQVLAGSATFADASLAQPARELARVIYAYKPSNEDELAIEVGDIIRVIDKEIEDAGWWKGELKGNIGVFPDNFVQLIDSNTVDQEFQRQHQHQQQQQQQPWPNGSSNVQSLPNVPKYTMNTPSSTSSENVVEVRAPKPVFAGQLKGFSKELESSLDKHSNNPVSFLSLKRNKSQQQQAAPDQNECSSATENGNINHQITLNELDNDTNSPTKLNHITVNRAKGPSRKPPSNRRAPSDQGVVKTDKQGKDPPSTIQQVATVDKPQVKSETMTTPQMANQEGLRVAPGSIPLERPRSGERPKAATKSVTDTPEQPASSKFEEALTNQLAASKGIQRQPLWVPPATTEAPKSTSTPPWMVELKKAHAEKKRDTPSISGQEDNTSPNMSASITTPTTATTPTTINSNPIAAMSLRKKKVGQQFQTSQQTTPVTESQQPQEATNIGHSQHVSPPSGAVRSLSSRYSGDFTASAATTDKADQSQQKVNTQNDSKVINSNGSSTTPTVVASATSSRGLNANNHPGSAPSSQHQSPIMDVKHPTEKHKSPSTAGAQLSLDRHTDGGPQQQDDTVKQFPSSIQRELDGFRQEIKQLKENFGAVSELKAVVEVMKCELRDCKSAIESQKRYMKDLLNNLADERKKIAAMQVEIDRTLK